MAKTQQRRVVRRTNDPELRAMQQVKRILEGLSLPAAARVLAWHGSKVYELLTVAEKKAASPAMFTVFGEAQRVDEELEQGVSA